MERAHREDEGSTRSINFLADLPGLLSVGVQVLERE
jgi:hypothetical protein